MVAVRHTIVQNRATQAQPTDDANAAKEAGNGASGKAGAPSATTEFEGANAGKTSADQKRLEGLQKLVESDEQALAELSADMEAGKFPNPAAMQQAESHADLLKERIASNSAALAAAQPEVPAADKKLEGDLSLVLDKVKQGAPGGKAAAPIASTAESARTAGVGTTAKADPKAEVYAHRALRLGAEGADVKELTTHLANQKPPLLKEATETFTTEVQDAVRQFQEKKKLMVDGIVGEQTWGAVHGISLPPGTSNLRPATAQEIVAHEHTAGPVAEAAAAKAGAEAGAATEQAATAEATAEATAKAAPEKEESSIEKFLGWISEKVGLGTGTEEAAEASPSPSAEAIEQFQGAIRNATVSPEVAKEMQALYKENDALSRDYASSFKQGAEGLAEAGKTEASEVLSAVGDAARTLNTAGAARAAVSAHQNLSRYMTANAEKILMSDPAFAEAAVTGTGLNAAQLAEVQDPRLKRLAEVELAARGKFEVEAAKAWEVAAGIEAGKDGFLDADEIAILKLVQEQRTN